LNRSVRRLFLIAAFLGCTAPQPREPFVLRVAVWGPLGAFPSGSEPGLASIAEPWVFEKVVTIDGKGELAPALAARVERLPGNLIRLELRSGANFSDGAPVTVDDVARSLEHSGLDARREQGALVVGSREKGMPADALLLQAEVVREASGKAVGSGPYVLASRTETELRLVRRQPEPGRIQEIRVIAYASTREAFSHTLRGNANMIVDLESRWEEFFLNVPSLQVIRGVGHSTDAITFNADLPRRERVQLARLLESQRVRELAYGDGECAERAVGDPGITPPPGAPLRILSWGPFERLALSVRRALGERGGEVSHLAPQEVVARLRVRDFDLFTGRPIKWPPASMALVWRTGAPGNVSGYSNPALDRAIAAADWGAAEAVLRDDPPAAFICTRNQLAVVDARIRNPRLGPYDLLETLPDWEVAQ
jgi:hypothetical protein